jgi:hypothetical protein
MLLATIDQNLDHIEAKKHFLLAPGLHGQGADHSSKTL